MNKNSIEKRIHRKKQKGAVLLLVAGGMVVLLGMTAFAVDIGRAMVVRNELQNVSDAASLAGASRIGSFFDQDWESACSAAENVVGNNSTEGNAMTLGDTVIEYGLWSDSAKTFTSYGPCVGSPSNIDDIPATSFPAIRAVVRRDDTSTSGAIKLFFAPVLGVDKIQMSATSTAVIATSSVGSGALPFVISSCSLKTALDADGEPIIGHEFTTIAAQDAAADVSPNCVEKGQWSAFCSTESGGCNGAGMVKSLLNQVDDIEAPNLSGDLTLTNIDNGTKTSLYKEAKKELTVGDSYLVPVVDSTAVNKGNNSVTPILNFIAVELVNVSDKNGNGAGNLSFSFRVTDPIRVSAGRPSTGNQFAGTITNAILVN